MTQQGRTRGRILLLLIAAVFFGPLLGAAWLYYRGSDLLPESRVNHGVLLEPIVNLVDAVPASTLHSHPSWRLLYAGDGPCAAPCRAALHTMRQSRLMLGKEMDRLDRVFLHGGVAPDNLPDTDGGEGLILLEDAGLRAVLDNKRPVTIPAGGFFLIDPHGNLVLYFSPDIEPRDMVDDIKRLLRLSRIG